MQVVPISSLLALYTVDPAIMASMEGKVIAITGITNHHVELLNHY
jgi:hypothetical protein